MRVSLLIKSLQMAEKNDIEHASIKLNPDTGKYIIVGKIPGALELTQIYPMPEEEYAKIVAQRPPKIEHPPYPKSAKSGNEAGMTDDTWLHSDYNDDDDDYFGDDNGKMYESIQKLKKEFKRFL
jgi:hypothetical protein